MVQRVPMNMTGSRDNCTDAFWTRTLGKNF
jgi:hypothetical protein